MRLDRLPAVPGDGHPARVFDLLPPADCAGPGQHPRQSAAPRTASDGYPRPAGGRGLSDAPFDDHPLGPAGTEPAIASRLPVAACPARPERADRRFAVLAGADLLGG